MFGQLMKNAERGANQWVGVHHLWVSGPRHPRGVLQGDGDEVGFNLNPILASRVAMPINNSGNV